MMKSRTQTVESMIVSTEKNSLEALFELWARVAEETKECFIYPLESKYESNKSSCYYNI